MTGPNDAMVDDLVAEGLVAGAVEAAFRSVLRERFLPGVDLGRVYEANRAILTRQAADGMGLSSSSAPTIMAIMLTDLDVHVGARVLEIGAGTGYNAALLAHLVGPAGTVTTVDIDDDVAAEARAHLAASGVSRVDVRAGDGWEGAADRGPFDRIIVTVGVTDLAPAWREQLRDGGRLVAPLSLSSGLQVSATFVRRGDRLVTARLERCGFMPFRGPNAGPSHFVALEDVWSSSYDHLGPSEVERLRRLHPQLTEVGSVVHQPAGWEERLALGDARFLRLWAFDPCQHPSRTGLFDAAKGGLAVIEDQRILAAGDAATADELRVFVESARPLGLDQLEVEAVPAGSPVDSDGAWVVARPATTFVVRER